MLELTPIERANQFIQQGQMSDARRALADILKTNPQDAMAWALSARLAPDSERCAYALHQVVDRSQDNELAQWAIHQLGMVMESGRMDSSEPPLLKLLNSNTSLDEIFRMSAQSPRKEPLAPAAPAPIKLSKPLPAGNEPQAVSGRMGYAARDVGGLMMIGGVLLIVIAAVSQGVFDAIASTGILPGWIGITLIVVGGGIAAVDYLTA